MKSFGRSLLVALSSACCVLVATGAALAQPGGPPPAAPPPPPPPQGAYYAPMPPPPDAHRHDDFFLRTFLGFAFTSMTASDIDTSVKGPGGTFGLALGANVSPGVIIYGEVFDDIAIEPTVEMGGMEADLNNVNAGVVGFGVGLAYYLPSNMYLSGTLAASKLTVQMDGEEIGRSDVGFGVSAMVGKEWWVSDNWGLGLGGQLFLGSMKEQDFDYTWTAVAGGLVGSATYD